MLNKNCLTVKSKKGQSVVEYFILFLLISLATILSLDFYYSKIRGGCQEAIYNVMERGFMHSEPPEED